MGKLKTSQDWLCELNNQKNKKTLITDPDGWDRQNYEYSFRQELITKEEFERRLNKSTVFTREF